VINLKSKRRINYFQLIAVIVLVSLILVFVYILLLSSILNPQKRQIVADNEVIDVTGGSYEAIRFEVPMEFGVESFELQFQVLAAGGNPSGDGVNVFISDSLGRFECQKNEASAPRANSTLAANCLELITIIEAQSLNATSGRIEESIREGMFYLVIDNIGSRDAKQVRVSLTVIAD
jgi:hypothetical protein